jgi:hypothetical protein
LKFSKYNKPLRCSEIASQGFKIQIFLGKRAGAGTGAGVVASNLHNLFAIMLIFSTSGAENEVAVNLIVQHVHKKLEEVRHYCISLSAYCKS